MQNDQNDRIFARQLGDAVKSARCSSELTQEELSEKAGIATRTILNIENHQGNPKMEVLYPLIRCLKIDSNEIFYPELKHASPSVRQLHLLLDSCSDEEAKELITVFNHVISLMRSQSAKSVN